MQCRHHILFHASQVEAKKAVPKENHPGPRGSPRLMSPGRTKKVFVGGLTPSIDEAALRQYFEQFGGIQDAVVMYDHDNRRVSLNWHQIFPVLLLFRQQARVAEGVPFDHVCHLFLHVCFAMCYSRNLKTYMQSSYIYFAPYERCMHAL